MSLFVGNLSPHVQHRELENAFRRFGRSNLELKDGYGFVIYEEHRDAESALRALQGRFVCGERLSLSWARKHRPFQRFSVKGSPLRRSWDKGQGQFSRRRPSLESDKKSSDDKKGYGVPTLVKDGSGASEPKEDAAGNIAREEEWKDQETERATLEDETRDFDPLDSGRWGEPLSDGYAEHIMGDGTRDSEDLHHDKEREDIEGSLHEKSHRSPLYKSFEHSSRAFWNSRDQYKRGRDVVGKPQERCFNCGQLGHVMKQCRSRDMYHRDGFDGRRTQFRNFRGIGFRGMGGRFRGMDGPRRVFNRDMEGRYGRRIVSRKSSRGDRRLYEQPDAKSYKKSRSRDHRYDNQRDSASIERSKKKHKKSSKNSSHTIKKHRRSSSDLESASRRSGSSYYSPSCSRSHSRSRSCSAPSRSLSSESQSRSSSSRSHSRKSQSESSRSSSLRASSRSRSRSGSSCSRELPSKCQSQTSEPRSRSVSKLHSPPRSLSADCGLPSQSPKPVEGGSPFLHENPHEEPESHRKSSVAAMYTLSTRGGTQKKQVAKTVDKSETQATDGSTHSLEDRDINDEQFVIRKERSQHVVRESKNQKDQTGSDDEELNYATEKLSNSANCASERIKNKSDKTSFLQETVMNEGCLRNYPLKDQNVALPARSAAGQGSLGVSEEPSSLLTEMVQASAYNAYLAVRKESGKRVAYDGQRLGFGAARLWPWEVMLHRRLKRGPISTANYERRKLQNEEFGIEDKFVRSSSGWWEKYPE